MLKQFSTPVSSTSEWTALSGLALRDEALRHSSFPIKTRFVSVLIGEKHRRKPSCLRLFADVRAEAPSALMTAEPSVNARGCRTRGALAHLVERNVRNVKVRGSSPLCSTQ